MEYPKKRVTLLIDDPSNPADHATAEQLTLTRHLPRELDAIFRAQERHYASQLASFEERAAGGAIDAAAEAGRIAVLYSEVATWFENQAAGFAISDHTDNLFVSRILLEPARAHRLRSSEIATRSKTQTTALSQAELRREYRRLASLFSARLGSFERKRFENLSHAPNKAMNLNSYIGLIGRHFREVIRPTGLHLEECDAAAGHLHVAETDYIVTLDADSLLLSDYALLLIRLMEQPGSQRFAVVGSPYSAVRGGRSHIENAAGAQTDAQWIMSEGLTYYGAAFWVGANAVLRRAALEDICKIELEREYPIRRYIQARTLVEDTESSIDLVARGWQLHNYPERLSFSATPQDFGSLIIQRRRWANGGLLILPNLLRYFARAPGRRTRETLFRFHYLVTTATSNIGMLMLLCVPFRDSVPTFWLIIATLPYYFLTGRDLASYDYEWADLIRVYALNLLLIPVNLTGVAQSIRQAWTGRVAPFARTPKVKGRISAARGYILGVLAILFFASAAAITDLYAGKWAFFLFGFGNAILCVYALIRFVGVRESWQDVIGRYNEAAILQTDIRAPESPELAANQG
jgi:hypothetical protein